MRVQSLGREDPLEEGMATHCSVLAWRILWTEEPAGLQSIGSPRIGHGLSDSARTHARHHVTAVSLESVCSTRLQPTLGDCGFCLLPRLQGLVPSLTQVP